MLKSARATISVMAAAALLVLGTTTVSMAGSVIVDGIIPPATCSPTAPEIDPSTGVAALALIAGAVLMIRARRSR